MKYIAVKDFELQILADGTDVTSANPNKATVQTQPNANMKIDGNAAYCGSVKVQVAGLVVQGFTQDGSTVFTFNLTAEHVKLDGDLVLLEADTTEEQTLTFRSGDNTTTHNIKLVVKKAGQTTVKGD